MHMLATTTEGLGAALGVLAVFGIIGLALTVYWIMMLVSAIKVEESQLRAGSKVLWIVLIVVLGALGGLIYQLTAKPKTA